MDTNSPEFGPRVLLQVVRPVPAAIFLEPNVGTSMWVGGVVVRPAMTSPQVKSLT